MRHQDEPQPVSCEIHNVGNVLAITASLENVSEKKHYISGTKFKWWNSGNHSWQREVIIGSTDKFWPANTHWTQKSNGFTFFVLIKTFSIDVERFSVCGLPYVQECNNQQGWESDLRETFLEIVAQCLRPIGKEYGEIFPLFSKLLKVPERKSDKTDVYRQGCQCVWQ